MSDEIDPIVSQFISDKYGHCDVSILSGLKRRDLGEIWNTLKDNRVVVIQPSLLDETQIRTLTKSISHGIWINFHSNTNNLHVRKFDFLSSDPYNDAKQIIDYCKGLKDDHGENALVKIVKSLEVNFYGFDDTRYELRAEGYFGDYILVRHSQTPTPLSNQQNKEG